MKMSKRIKTLKERIKQESYEINEAIQLVKDIAIAKFDETIEIAIKLGLDVKKYSVRGTSLLPNGIGKTKKILVFAEGDKAKEAQSAGADFVGSDEYIDKIQKGWLEFDSAIATPDLMPKISKLGKILGPRGLMPNPKTGTLTNEIAKTVKELKLGRIEFKMDKSGCIHSAVGKASFDNEKLLENITEFIKSVMAAKPTDVPTKKYIKTVHISATMSPSVKISSASIEKLLKT